MKTTEQFRKTIEAFIESEKKADALFAECVDGQPEKTIQGCVNYILHELKKLNSQAKDWEQYYKEQKGKYFPIVFDNGKIFCHVMKSVAEICEEGTRMHHCVFRMGYYKKRESLILSARDRQGNRLETVEVNLDSYKVVQSRGLQNSYTSAHDEIISLVNKNMNLIRRAGKRQNLSK